VTLAFFDVDGVFSPYPRIDDPPPGYVRHEIDVPNWHQVTVILNPQHGEWIRALDVQPVWATAWGRYANEYIAPRIGTDPWPVAPVHRKFSDYDMNSAYKWDGVLEYAAGRPFVWVDDEFTPACHRRANQRARMGTPTALVSVDPVVGLTTGHMDAVRAFTEWDR
jgi:hypothetical protein